ncbi:MAG: DegV family protein [Candidatus Pacebacteria bacterium]|nr:DegV family protein [Candidatus Paceibacterota bacterium]
MKTTKIVIGDSASITLEIIEKYGMISVPFTLDWPDREALDGNNIFEKMRDAEKKNITTTPKTSQPSMGLFKKAFETGLSEAETIICITISSAISGTYNSAVQAKKMFPEDIQKKIFIVDTFNADASESLLAIKAAELAEEGKTGEEIFKIIESLLPKTLLFGMIESPKWLEAGGRLSHAVAVLLAQMQKLGMRPILTVKDGLVKPANLRMQAQDTANALFKQFEDVSKKSLSEGKTFKVGISHADNLEQAQKLRGLFEAKYPQVKIEFISLTSLVIGAHVGPGTLICCILEN